MRTRVKNNYQKNRDKILDYQKQYYIQNKDKILNRVYKYQQSNKGRKVHNKANKKYRQSNDGREILKLLRIKHREKGYTIMFSNPFDDLEDIEWHHIDDSSYVIALPKDLHRLVLGRNHKEICMEIVKQIYLD